MERLPGNDRYLRTDLLGKGSFGTVFRAERKNSDARCAQVAIKVVTIEKGDEEKYERRMAAIQLEVSLLKQCDGSPFVVKIVEAFVNSSTRPNSEANDQVFIVMECCENGTLANVIDQCREVDFLMPERCIQQVTTSIVLALKFLHARCIVHGDCKPENVLIDSKGRAKLGDFSESQSLRDAPDNRLTTRVGSPFWMSPEVIQQRPHDTKADIWSLGATVYEMAVGEPPYFNLRGLEVGLMLFLILQRPVPTLPDPDTWSPEMMDFVKCCCRKNPDKRLDSFSLSRHPFVNGKILELEELYSENDGGFQESPLLDLMRFLKWKARALIHEREVVNETEPLDLDTGYTSDSGRSLKAEEPSTPATVLCSDSCLSSVTTEGGNQYIEVQESVDLAIPLLDSDSASGLFPLSTEGAYMEYREGQEDSDASPIRLRQKRPRGSRFSVQSDGQELVDSQDDLFLVPPPLQRERVRKSYDS